MSNFVSFELVTDSLEAGLRQCAALRSASKRFWLTRLARLDGGDGRIVFGRNPSKGLVLRGVVEADEGQSADPAIPFSGMLPEQDFDDIIQNTGPFRFPVYGADERTEVAPKCKRLFGGGSALGATGRPGSARPTRTTKSIIEEADRYRKERYG